MNLTQKHMRKTRVGGSCKLKKQLIKLIFSDRKKVKFLSPLMNMRNLPNNSQAVTNKLNFWSQSSADDRQGDGSFQMAIKPILILCQLFGIMPVCGITSPKPSNLRFSWTSFRTWYSTVGTVALFFQICFVARWAFDGTMDFSRYVSFIFNVSNLFAMFQFFKIAQKWPELMMLWRDMELCMQPLQDFVHKYSLKRELAIISSIILVLSLIEHILAFLTLVQYVEICAKTDNLLREIFYNQFKPLYSYFHFPNEFYVKAIYGRYCLTVLTFLWTFMDLFVILISKGLSRKFKDFNYSLKLVANQNLGETFWEQKRAQHRILCDLCQYLDEAISTLTLIAFSNDIFFICVQLLNSLNPKLTTTHEIYFWFSLCFLIGRTLSLSLYTAEIHDESRKPIEVLRRVSKDSWCSEVKRFYDQIQNEIVAFSGMRFFFFTRRLILSVAGTVVTYELVLLQINEEDDEVNLCKSIMA